MADKLMRAQVRIQLDAGLPEDAIVNTWHFDGDDIADATQQDFHDSVMTLLTTFYQSIDGVLFPNTVETPAEVKIYDLREPEPRVPEFTGSIALAPSATGPLPGEIALCLSFKAATESGDIPARRRGRIFLGHIATDAAVIIGSQSRPSLAARTAVADAAEVMLAGDQVAGFAGSVRWAIYSPTTDLTDTLDNSFHDVQSGWVDDAWDIQRRRGAVPTARVNFA